MFIVVGTPGAGKTTLLNAFKEKHKEWDIINYGTYMFEIAQSFGIKSRDEMRKAPLELQRKIQAKVGEKLSEVKKREVVLDTHASIKTPKGYLPGLPLHILNKLSVEGIILITAKPEEIMGRREKDKTRERDREGIEEIKEHDEMNRRFCTVYSALSGAPFSILYNKEGKLDESVKALERILL